MIEPCTAKACRCYRAVCTSKVAGEWKIQLARCSAHVLRINKCCVADCIKSSVLRLPAE